MSPGPKDLDIQLNCELASREVTRFHSPTLYQPDNQRYYLIHSSFADAIRSYRSDWIAVGALRKRDYL